MMREKIANMLVLALAVICIAFTAFAFAACLEDEESKWDVSAKGASVSARLVDDGKYGFILEISGTGSMRDFSSVKDAPWYGKSGRIKGVAVASGVTYIGNNALTESAVKSAVLPQSVTAVGRNAFPSAAIVYAYSEIECGSTVYVYSENKPDADGKYWRYKNGEPSVWDTVKVLFIGNSFTFYNDMPQLFETLVNSIEGESVTVESVTQGSWTLTKFADATDEYGAVVDEKLTSADDYDIVILQEQSTRPLNNYNTFSAAVKSLQTKIKHTQRDCKVYLYATWGYAEEAAARGMTIPEMCDAVRNAYDSVGSSLGISVSHVGSAFAQVYTAHPEINLYFTDNMHPSYEGSYLAACVHAATVLGCDPTSATFTGALDTATAELLRTAARGVTFN